MFDKKVKRIEDFDEDEIPSDIRIEYHLYKDFIYKLNLVIDDVKKRFTSMEKLIESLKVNIINKYQDKIEELIAYTDSVAMDDEL